MPFQGGHEVSDLLLQFPVHRAGSVPDPTVRTQRPDFFQEGIPFPHRLHPASATEDVSTEGRLLVVRVVVEQHQDERFLLELRKDLRHVVVIPAVNPPDPRRTERFQATTDFRLRLRVAVASRTLDILHPDPAERKAFSIQVGQESLRLQRSRKIGDHDIRFHLSKVTIFREFPFISFPIRPILRISFTFFSYCFISANKTD